MPHRKAEEAGTRQPVGSPPVTNAESRTDCTTMLISLLCQLSWRIIVRFADKARMADSDRIAVACMQGGGCLR